MNEQAPEKANTIPKLGSRGEVTRPEVIILFGLFPVDGCVPG